MIGNISLFGCFALGILLGIAGWLPAFAVDKDLSRHALYVMIFLVGISIGANKEVMRTFRTMSAKALLVPLAAIVGTLIGVSIVSLIIEIPLFDAMAVGSGFGYYSLSSILITEAKGERLGVIALFSNIFREVITLLFTPLMVRYLGKIAPIVTGGATTIDSTMAVILKYTGKQYAVLAIVNGIFLELSVPLLVSFFVWL